jgi:hypothetical protein
MLYRVRRVLEIGRRLLPNTLKGHLVSHPKRSSKRKRLRKAIPALGAAAGLSLAVAGDAGAVPVAPLSCSCTGTAQEVILAEEEISDVSLATFYVFDTTYGATFGPNIRLVRGGCGGGCGGCRGCGGCGGCRGCGGFGGCGGCGGWRGCGGCGGCGGFGGCGGCGGYLACAGCAPAWWGAAPPPPPLYYYSPPPPPPPPPLLGRPRPPRLRPPHKDDDTLIDMPSAKPLPPAVEEVVVPPPLPAAPATQSTVPLRQPSAPRTTTPGTIPD